MNDPQNYREMCKPHESLEAFNASLEGFWADVAEVRKKHKIANVHISVASPYLTTDGDEAEAAMSGHLGDSTRALGLAAFGYGFEKRSMQEEMDRLVNGNLRKPS